MFGNQYNAFSMFKKCTIYNLHYNNLPSVALHKRSVSSTSSIESNGWTAMEWTCMQSKYVLCWQTI